jgi:membrane protease subunit HflK
VQYRVTDPYSFLFKVRDLTGTFRSMSQAVMREVVGDRTVTEVLTVGRQEIATTSERLLQELVNQYEMGIVIEQIVLQDVTPPDPVKPSWDEVNQAQQQRDRLINEALAEYNKVVPRAKGEASQAVLQAEGYALERVNSAEGDATRFKAVYEAYRRAPEVTRRRLYLESMQRVLPLVGTKVFTDKGTTTVIPIVPGDALKALIPPAPGRPGGGQ